MWEKLSHFILRQRVAILVVMLLVTGFMGWMAKAHLELSYKYARVLPVDDSMYIAYEKFKAKYGEDGNVLVIGFKDTNMFQLSKYQGWYDLTDSISRIEGIENVMSTARLYNMKMNDSIDMFDVVPVVSRRPETQDECDSLKKVIMHLPFYEGLILNKKEMATVMAVTFTQKDLNTKNRLAIVNRIRNLTQTFGEKYNIAISGVDANGNGTIEGSEQSRIHVSGMPWIRSEYMRKIAGESSMLLILSILATALILFIFFRYFNAVFFSLIIVIIGLIWSLGTIALFDYKITVLSGLIPSLIVIIGIPNCIFLINKYQEELVAHGNKTRALARMVQKVGLSNFLANITTSIGFGVFYFTNSSLLVEFGVVAAINVMTTYFIALVLTPIAFSYLPPPKAKQMKHLSGTRINRLLAWVDRLVHHHRPAIYITIAIATLIAGLGFFKVKVNGYVVDDLPQKDPIYVDLKFFEKNFNGILPFEIVVEVKPQLTDSIRKDYAAKGIKINPDDFAADTLGPKNIFLPDGEVLFSIDTMEKFISARPEFSKAVSVTEAIKFANQALSNGK
ncbi:MAG TPA: MMPL family transporter, partial [Bacteroidia bacterium]|nr:MMPL family transporter [Bacteroidia bacterium]